MEELTKLLGKVAPWLAAAAAGPAGLAGMAVKTVADALGASDTTVASIAAAVAGASPEQLQQLKLAELQFKVRMQELGFQHETDLAKIAADDRASARDREIKTGDSMTPRILAALFISGWFGVQWFLLQHVIASEMREIVMRSLGTMDMALGLILGYYFGSSAGSAHKNDLLGRQSPGG